MHPSLTILTIGCAALLQTAPAQVIAPSYDTPSYVEFASSRFEVSDGATNAVITVVRSGDFRKSAAVDFVTRDGTAEGNVDYLPAGGTLVFGSGQGFKTITIPILRDGEGNGLKTFGVQLQNPGANTIVLSDSAQVEIAPEPPRLAIEINKGKITVSWPDVGLPFNLEGRVDNEWFAIGKIPQLVDGSFSTVIANDSHVTLFRLRL